MLTRPRRDPSSLVVLASCALSNDVQMSVASDSNGRPEGPEGAEGVLANLPRTRPQRSSARRAAARRQASASQPADRAANAASDAAARTGAAPAGPTGAAPAKKAARKASKPRAAATKAGAQARKPAGTARKSPSRAGATATKRSATAGTTAAKGSAGAGASATRRPAKKTVRSAPLRGAQDAREQVPRQGFESEMDRARGPVQPPGGAELVASAAEIVGELARAGLSTGERLQKDALTRLPHP
jgi:hypothetical protein